MSPFLLSASSRSVPGRRPTVLWRSAARVKAYVAVVVSDLYAESERKLKGCDEAVQIRGPKAATHLYLHDRRIGNRDLTLVIPVEFLNRIVERLTLESKATCGPGKPASYVFRRHGSDGNRVAPHDGRLAGGHFGRRGEQRGILEVGFRSGRPDGHTSLLDEYIDMFGVADADTERGSNRANHGTAGHYVKRPR